MLIHPRPPLPPAGGSDALLMAAGVLLILAADQALKSSVLRWLPEGGLPRGGPLRLNLIRSRFWLDRWGLRPHPLGVGGLWCSAAVVLILVAVWLPSLRWPVTALLGGSLSHALETSWRGHIIDCLCLHSRLAFNIADLAITLGSLALLLQLPAALLARWP